MPLRASQLAALGAQLPRARDCQLDADRVAVVVNTAARSGARALPLVEQALRGVAAVFGGRAHYYETGNPAVMRLPLEVLKALGAEAVIATNAAGSMRPDIRPGDLMLLSDHINFSGLNPLIGEPSDGRFVGMTSAYDAELQAAMPAWSLHWGQWHTVAGSGHWVQYEAPEQTNAIMLDWFTPK